MSEQKSDAKEPTTTKFIFIGDPNDGGAGSRAIDEDDDDGFRGMKIYGLTFPKGKAVEVRFDAKIGGTGMSVVDKLRGNTHFFEGTESEFKSAGIAIKKAKPKTPRLVKNIGVRGVDVAGDDDE